MLPNVASLATYGGQKFNQTNIEDASRQESADEHNEQAIDTAALTQTAPRAIRRFVGHATTPEEPGSGPSHRNVWGDAPILLAPVTKGGTGIYDITYDETVTDALGVTRPVNLEGGWVNIPGSTLYHHNVEITAPNVARVRIWDATNAPNDAVGATIEVYLR